MTLKKATKIAIMGTLIEMIWGIVSWTCSTFELVNYSNYRWFYSVWLIPHLVFYGGLFTFFVTLKNKQEG